MRSAKFRPFGQFVALIFGMLSWDPNSQICSYLTPTDLLHVVQSSKVFALFLLAPSSAAVWRASRTQFDNDLPDCPDDLTEQQFANLVFGNACHVR